MTPRLLFILLAFASCHLPAQTASGNSAGTASLAGIVRNEEGNAVEGVNVRTSGIGDWGGPRTDASGRFTIPDLAPGQYRLRLRPPGRLVSGRDGTGDEYVSTYYPSGPGDPQAKMIQLEPGAHLMLDLVLPRKTVTRATVRGKLAGPVMGARVVITEEDGYHFQTACSVVPGPDGAFQFQGVAPGRYKLVSDSTGNLQAINGWMEIDVPPNGLENVLFATRPAFHLAGRIIFEGGNAGGVEIDLSPAGFANAWRAAVAASDGALSFTRVLAEKYRVVVRQLPAGAYVASIRAGGREISLGTEFTPDPSAPLVITLKSR